MKRKWTTTITRDGIRQCQNSSAIDIEEEIKDCFKCGKPIKPIYFIREKKDNNICLICAVCDATGPKVPIKMGNWRHLIETKLVAIKKWNDKKRK